MIPLALGAAISPTMLAGVILILSSKDHPKIRTFAFFVGALVTVIAIGIIAVGVGGAAKGPDKPSAASASIDIVLGALLIAVAVRRFFSEPKPQKQTKSEDKQAPLSILLAEGIGLGIIFVVTDFTSLVFYLAAAKETADSGLGVLPQTAGMSIVGLFFLLPVILPLLIVSIFPGASSRVLDALNQAMKKYSRYIIILIAAIFGIYLVYKGLVVFF